MSEIIFLLISVCIFVILTKYTDKCVYILFSVIKGGTLLLICNWIFEILNMPSVGVNLFTSAFCGFLGFPAAATLWIITVFL